MSAYDPKRTYEHKALRKGNLLLFSCEHNRPAVRPPVGRSFMFGTTRELVVPMQRSTWALSMQTA